MKKYNNQTKYGASLIALAFSLSAANYTYAQTCPSAPSCDELGYTRSASECETTPLKCPFDKTKYFCFTTVELEETPPPASDELEETTPSASDCTVGNILYSDKTCSTDLISGKTAIGVVFNTEKRLAIALQSQTAYWSIVSFDVPGLVNKTSESEALEDWAGRANTTAATNFCTANRRSCPAFDYVNSYQTTGTKAGDWYLPALGELKAIYDNRDILNTALSKTGGTQLPDTFNWSSSEYYGSAWYVYFDYGTINHDDKTGNHYVRPVLSF